MSDRTAPTPVITSSETSPSHASPIPVLINFGEVVSGFVAGDVVVSGGTLAGFATSDNQTFTFDLTPSGDGAVTVDVAADVAEDLAGNQTLAATQFSIVSDRTAPTPVITSSETSPSNASSIPISVNFGEVVNGFVAGDVVVSGGTLAGFATSDNQTFTFDLTPSGDGTISVDVAADAAEDLAGNKSLAATQFSIVSDGTSPTVMSFTWQTPASSPTDADVLIFRATFDEDVMSVAMDSFAVNGATTAAVTALSSVNAATYDVTVSGGNLANFNGTVGLDLAVGQDISDLAGNSLPTVEPEIDETYVVNNDEDGDGAADYFEDGAANGGDGNNDGIPDREQKNVASLPCFTGEGYVTLVASQEISLTDTDAADNPSPDDAPDGISFPAGFFEFGIGGFAQGGSVVVTVNVETTANTYYRFGPTPDNPAPHWYPFMYDGSTGAKIYSDRVELHFVDGRRGDDDLIADGSIIDLGAPGVTDHPWQNPMIPKDVNNDALVSSLDVLALIQRINTNGIGQLPLIPSGNDAIPSFWDVSGDNQLSPVDVLEVIQYINANTGGEGEQPQTLLHRAWNNSDSNSGWADAISSLGAAESLSAFQHPATPHPELPSPANEDANPDRRAVHSHVASSESGGMQRLPVAESTRANETARRLAFVDDELSADSLEKALSTIAQEIAAIWDAYR